MLRIANIKRRWATPLSLAMLLLVFGSGCARTRPGYLANDPTPPGQPLWSSPFGSTENAAVDTTVRGQNEGPNGEPRGPMPPANSNINYSNPNEQSYPRDWGPQAHTAYQPPSQPNSGFGVQPGNAVPLQLNDGSVGGFDPRSAPGDLPLQPGEVLGMPQNFANIDAFVEEARTGRFMFGVGVNSDAGVTGQIVIDERNFDIMRPPRRWSDFSNGTAFRGAGQGFRIEAMPGSQVQRYMASFTEPYLFDTPISMSLSAFYFDRNFFDWDEQRGGGRMTFGYRLTPDLSLSVSGRAEKVRITNPRVVGVAELDQVVGDNDVFVGQVTLTHDTRDIPFAPTEGHLIELSYQQGFGTFDYPRGDLTFAKYHLVRQRADYSGRHTFSYNAKVGITGSQTPIFENYYAGGFSTIRGFDFRGASPVNGGVIVGGEFRFLGSVEYMFPITGDDMLKGVVFCDFGTVEQDIAIRDENFRVAPGFGLRINIPALGPAPLALDLAFPVARADTDTIQQFSFFFGLGRF